MICLVVSQSRFCFATIVFYTCIWIPLLQLKKALLGILGVVFFSLETTSIDNFQPWLPVARFVDLQGSTTTSSATRSRNDVVLEETCTICLVEFEKEDAVSQLSKCGHVFHIQCIEKWLDSNHFTCPLCRSSFLNNVNQDSHDAVKPPASEIIINPYTPSYLGFSWH